MCETALSEIHREHNKDVGPTWQLLSASTADWTERWRGTEQRQVEVSHTCIFEAHSDP